MTSDLTTRDATTLGESHKLKEPIEPHVTEARRIRLAIPEGMSKNQWKKIQKKAKLKESKAEWKASKRERRREARSERNEKVKELRAQGIDPATVLGPKPAPKPRSYKPEEQIDTGIKVIFDCDFDHMMNEKELKSLSIQLTRSYSEGRRQKQRLNAVVSSFEGLLKTRFDTDLSDYLNWPRACMDFTAKNVEELTQSDKEHCVYLSADTSETLDELKPGYTYIIGGIVDKGRYKNLCQKKAEEMGIQTRRLPIDEFIQMSGRQVLATSHVFDLLLKWCEHKDWKEAFEKVLPPRKLMHEEDVASSSNDQ